jgi:hypothetical protein
MLPENVPSEKRIARYVAAGVRLALVDSSCIAIETVRQVRKDAVAALGLF